MYNSWTNVRRDQAWVGCSGTQTVQNSLKKNFESLRPLSSSLKVKMYIIHDLSQERWDGRLTPLNLPAYTLVAWDGEGYLYELFSKAKCLGLVSDSFCKLCNWRRSIRANMSFLAIPHMTRLLKMSSYSTPRCGYESSFQHISVACCN